MQFRHDTLEFITNEAFGTESVTCEDGILQGIGEDNIGIFLIARVRPTLVGEEFVSHTIEEEDVGVRVDS